MSSSNLSGLSDQIGDLAPNTPAETTAALLAALRASRSRDEARMFAAMLGLGDDQ